MTEQELLNSKATDQLIAAALEQAADFENGLNTVIKGAIDAQMQPLSIAVALARSLIRTAGALALAMGKTDEELKEMVNDLIDSVFEDMRDGYSKVAKQVAEKLERAEEVAQ